MTVNSDGANAFSFSGNGKITGAGSLTKSGTSTLTISTANDYSGGTTINAGTVIAADTTSVPGASSALGNGVINLASGAVLQIGNGTGGTGTVTGTAIHDAGSIVWNRPDSFTLNTPINGAGTLSARRRYVDAHRGFNLHRRHDGFRRCDAARRRGPMSRRRTRSSTSTTQPTRGLRSMASMRASPGSREAAPIRVMSVSAETT